MWLYHDDELQSDVAVKALADNWAQRLDIRDRFRTEPVTVARVYVDAEEGCQLPHLPLQVGLQVVVVQVHEMAAAFTRALDA